VVERGYEGYVAKDETSPYEGGATRRWLKVKVSGWTDADDRWRRVQYLSVHDGACDSVQPVGLEPRKKWGATPIPNRRLATTQRDSRARYSSDRSTNLRGEGRIPLDIASS
jgi:hypothetical protein